MLISHHSKELHSVKRNACCFAEQHITPGARTPAVHSRHLFLIGRLVCLVHKEQGSAPVVHAKRPAEQGGDGPDALRHRVAGGRDRSANAIDDCGCLFPRTCACTHTILLHHVQKTNRLLSICPHALYRHTTFFQETLCAWCF